MKTKRRGGEREERSKGKGKKSTIWTTARFIFNNFHGNASNHRWPLVFWFDQIYLFIYLPIFFNKKKKKSYSRDKTRIGGMRNTLDFGVGWYVVYSQAIRH